MKTFEEVLAGFAGIEFEETFDMVVAIANGGVIPAAIINQRLNVELQLIKINLRDAKQQPVFKNPQLLAPITFNYKGRNILLVDDRVKSGATLHYAKELLCEEAATVKTFAVNGSADYCIYNEPCFKFPWLL